MMVDKSKIPIRIGFALCGSFCTHAQAVDTLERLVTETETPPEIIPILSEITASTDTRFGRGSDLIAKLEKITGNKVIKSVVEAEPIGPKDLLDILVIAPCTGNTLGKLAAGITDSSVTMAAKAHLRNNRPLLIAVSSNDALSASAKNIGLLMNVKNVFFVPMRQDDPLNKETSVVADFDLLPSALKDALNKRQKQPVYI